MKYVLIIITFFINTLYSQSNTKLIWGHMFFNSGNRNVGVNPFNPVPSNGRIDKNNRAYFIIPVYDSLVIFNESFTKAKKCNAVICCFDSLGKLIWKVPITGGQNKIQVRDITITSSGIFIFGGSVNDSLRIGNAVIFEPGGVPFNYLAGVSADGKLRFIKKAIEVTKLREAPLNQFLLFSYMTGTETMNGVTFTRGCYTTVLDSSCNIIEKIYLGQSLNQQIQGICLSTDNILYVTAKSEKNKVLNFLDSIYYPVDTTIGKTKSDNHLFALELVSGNRAIKWHLRIDSIVKGTSTPRQNLAADNDGHVYWSPLYNHPQTIFGRKLTMVNSGGYYPFTMTLDASNGNLLKSFYSDTVTGFDNNDLALMNKVNGNGINVFFSGSALEDFNFLPDSLTNLSAKVLFNFTDTFKFGQFYNTASNYFQNAFNTFVAPVQVYMTPAKLLHNTDTDGRSFSNNGGYDMFVGYYGPTHWPTILNNKSLQLFKPVIYPNPGYGILKFANSSQMKDIRYIVTDITGKTLQYGRVIDNTVNIESLSSGTYYILLQFENRNVAMQYLKINWN